jgi:serine phosphatase RsbU (regulator of sigma subunit)/CHASE3 domain sensor protein
MGLIVLGQYAATAATSIGIQDTLSPAVDSSAEVGLEQASASGSLADYVMLRRDASLDYYRQALGRATTLLADLRTATTDFPELSALVADATAAQRAWVKADAEPVIDLMADGKRVRAMRVTNSDEAWTTYDAMVEASNSLHDSLNATRTEASDVLTGFTRTLGITLLAVGVLVTLGLLLFFFGLQMWILTPLLALRDDITSAVRSPGHTSPIRPSGPPEISAVGKDAETLRRNLVSEIEEAEDARQGLMQDAPVVSAMQSELAMDDAPAIPGFELAGFTHSAEGVVAGDWWDAIVRPDGSLALVVADVSGHGPAAAITALRVRAVMRTALRVGDELDRVMALAAEACADDDHFVTAIILRLDRSLGTITWCNAGHHPAITVTKDKDASLCEPTGPLLSALGGEWEVRTRFFAAGDVVLAFTDGLVESRNAEGEELEAAAVGQFIRAMDGPVRENPGEMITRLLAQVRHRAADWRRDDITVIAAVRDA